MNEKLADISKILSREQLIKEKYEKELTEMYDMKAILLDKLTALQDKIYDLEAKNDEIKNSNAMLSNLISDLEKKNVVLEKRLAIQDFQKRLNDNATIFALEKKIEESEQIKDAYRNYIKTLEDKLKI